ncbi:helix-turn-helix domain-containing protein [Halohasta litorea]|uniref:Helix-turn-helix domain-containing protein n=1 Tax=Halohasta litorea TaxID=869891 RepID=A0ABD6DA18_9EURY|nr:helix-turn-helix domain-containing protein [Halohasta litorea]
MADYEPSELEKYIERNGWRVSTGEYDHEELDPPDWLTELDREICVLLGHGFIFTPSLIAKNIDRPRSSVSRRLNTLEAGGIVEKVERGHYKLTEEGYARLLERVEREGDWFTVKIPSPEEVEKSSEE